MHSTVPLTQPTASGRPPCPCLPLLLLLLLPPPPPLLLLPPPPLLQHARLTPCPLPPHAYPTWVRARVRASS